MASATEWNLEDDFALLPPFDYMKLKALSSDENELLTILVLAPVKGNTSLSMFMKHALKS